MKYKWFKCLVTYIITMILYRWETSKECSLGHQSYLRKRRHYFKNNYTYLVSLCPHEQVGDTIVDGWPQFECDFNVFAHLIFPYGSHCIDMTASPRIYQLHWGSSHEGSGRHPRQHGGGRVRRFSKFMANSHRVCSLLRPSFCELVVNVMGHIDTEFRAAVIRHLASIPA